MERRPPNKTNFDFWLIAKMICTAAIMIPTTWFRFIPIMLEIYQLYLTHGLLKTASWFPAYVLHLHREMGWHFYLALTQLFLIFAIAYLVAHTLQILLSRLILRFGFRAEEAEESRMLHPDQEV